MLVKRAVRLRIAEFLIFDFYKTNKNAKETVFPFQEENSSVLIVL